MKRIAAVLVVLVGLTGCNYKDIVMSQVAPVDGEPAYVTPPACANAAQHQTFERLGIDRPC